MTSTDTKKRTAEPTASRRTTLRDHREATALLTGAADLRAAESIENVNELHQRIRSVRRELVEAAGPVRISTAAEILDLDKKTVQAWLKTGILLPAKDPGTTRAVLDPQRLDAVVTIVRSLRAAGRNRRLLDAVWHRLQDDALRGSDEFSEAMDQKQRREGREWTEKTDGSWEPIG